MADVWVSCVARLVSVMRFHQIPPFQEAVRVLQSHSEHEVFESIGRQAVQGWSLLSQDQHLNNFAFAVRALFLANLIHMEGARPYASGGAIQENQQSQVLPSLSPRTCQSLIQHVRAHIPVAGMHVPYQSCDRSCHSSSIPPRVERQCTGIMSNHTSSIRSKPCDRYARMRLANMQA